MIARPLCALALAALAATAPARADDTPLPPLVQAGTALGAGDHWGVVSATTDAPGHDVLSLEFGFPGVSFGYTHGMSDSTDWGVRVDMLYGVLYTTRTQFGMGARLPLRRIIAQKGKMTVLLHIDPGLFTYASSSAGPSLFGLQVPVGAAIGFQPVPDLRVSFGVDIPLAVQFLHSTDFFFGPQFGFTAETFIDKEVSVGISMRFGPMFVPTQSSDAQLGFVAQATLGYRL